MFRGDGEGNDVSLGNEDAEVWCVGLGGAVCCRGWRGIDSARGFGLTVTVAAVTRVVAVANQNPSKKLLFFLSPLHSY